MTTRTARKPRTLDEHRAAAREGMRAALAEWRSLAEQAHRPRGLAVVAWFDWHRPDPLTRYEGTRMTRPRARSLMEALVYRTGASRFAAQQILALRIAWLLMLAHAATAHPRLVESARAVVREPLTLAAAASPLAPRAPSRPRLRVA